MVRRRFTIPGYRALRALRQIQADNFPHRGTLQHYTRTVDPITGRPTVTYVDGDTVNCRINPATVGGANIVAGQLAIAGEWVVSFPWDTQDLRELDRVLIQQGVDAEDDFAELVTIKKIDRPRTATTVVITHCESVQLESV